MSQFRPITRKYLAFLPAFVREKLLAVADEYEFVYESLAAFVYEERTGTIERSAQVNPLSFWIGHHHRVRFRLYLAGAACWIEPDSHAVYFDPIADDVLPTAPDHNIWWLIYDNGDGPVLHVCKITIVPGSEAPQWADIM